MKHYKAYWGKSLIVVSTLATFFCVGISVYLVWVISGALSWLALLPLAIILGSVPYIIRGYTITPNSITVHRLFWTTELPLTDLQSAEFEPGAMSRSLRTFGNGGLFSFTGFFRNKRLGAYRAFVTDLQKTVLLNYPDRTVVVSPSAPDQFIRDLPISSHSA